jgi:hypothetical protein
MSSAIPFTTSTELSCQPRACDNFVFSSTSWAKPATTARDANRLTSSQYAANEQGGEPFAWAQDSSARPAITDLPDELCDARDRWWSLPEDCRRQVLALLARLIARSVEEEDR